MSSYLQAFVLAVIQGVTEFLPISSSAHLIVVPYLMDWNPGWSDWEPRGLRFDIATHFGTLLAVLVYFRHRLFSIAESCVIAIKRGERNSDIDLLGNIVIATVPVVIVGFLAYEVIEMELRGVQTIAITTIGFGILLLVADLVNKRDRNETEMSWWQASLIGLGQAMALVPGVSRAGITITVALFLGFSRTAAARFSFLLAIPTVLAATLLMTADALKAASDVNWIELGVGVVVSFLSAYFCIDAFLRFVEKIGMMPFVIYRVVLGALLFVVCCVV